tara:strand:+ start:260 stop:481 length:222 start_codon:yes stop_codon:yes gene_type:complete
MRQFRADARTTVYFNYTKLHRSSDGAHYIEVKPNIKFWIPKVWITKFNRKKKRIEVKGYWEDELKLKLKGIVK